MRKLAAPIFALAVLPACDPAGPIIFPFPTPAAQGTQILTADDGRSVEGFVVSLDDRSVQLPFAVGDDRTTRLEAMIYEETPAELGLEEGPRMPHGENTATRPPKESFQTTARDGRVEPWSLLQTPSQLSRSFLPSIGCVKFDVQPVPAFVGSETIYRTGAALDSSSALLIARSSTDASAHYYRGSVGGVERLPDLMPGYTPRRIVYVPVSEGRDGMVFATANGGGVGERALLSGTLSSGFTPLPPRPEHSRCYTVGLDYERDGAPNPAVFVLDECGNIDRYKNGAWTRVRASVDLTYSTALAWVAPNEFVWAGDGGQQLWQLKNGADQLLESDVPLDRVLALSTVPGVGTFAGLNSGWVLKYNGTSWGTFRAPFIETVAVLAFASFDGNFLIGGRDGDIQHWVDPSFCADPTLVGIHLAIDDIIPLDFGIVAAGEQVLTTGGTRFFVAVLKRAD